MTEQSSAAGHSSSGAAHAPQLNTTTPFAQQAAAGAGVNPMQTRIDQSKIVDSSAALEGQSPLQANPGTSGAQPAATPYSKPANGAGGPAAAASPAEPPAQGIDDDEVGMPCPPSLADLAAYGWAAGVSGSGPAGSLQATLSRTTTAATDDSQQQQQQHHHHQPAPLLMPQGAGQAVPPPLLAPPAMKPLSRTPGVSDARSSSKRHHHRQEGAPSSSQPRDAAATAAAKVAAAAGVTQTAVIDPPNSAGAGGLTAALRLAPGTTVMPGVESVVPGIAAAGVAPPDRLSGSFQNRSTTSTTAPLLAQTGSVTSVAGQPGAVPAGTAGDGAVLLPPSISSGGPYKLYPNATFARAPSMPSSSTSTTTTAAMYTSYTQATYGALMQAGAHAAELPPNGEALPNSKTLAERAARARELREKAAVVARASGSATAGAAGTGPSPGSTPAVPGNASLASGTSTQRAGMVVTPSTGQSPGSSPPQNPSSLLDTAGGTTAVPQLPIAFLQPPGVPTVPAAGAVEGNMYPAVPAPAPVPVVPPVLQQPVSSSTSTTVAPAGPGTTASPQLPQGLLLPSPSGHHSLLAVAGGHHPQGTTAGGAGVGVGAVYGGAAEGTAGTGLPLTAAGVGAQEQSGPAPVLEVYLLQQQQQVALAQEQQQAQQQQQQQPVLPPNWLQPGAKPQPSLVEQTSAVSQTSPPPPLPLGQEALGASVNAAGTPAAYNAPLPSSAGEVPPDGASFKRLPSKHRTAAHPDLVHQRTPPPVVPPMGLSDSEFTDVNSGDDDEDEDGEINSDDDTMVSKGPYMGGAPVTAGGMPAMGAVAPGTMPVESSTTGADADRYPAVKPAGVYGGTCDVHQGHVPQAGQQGAVPISADGTFAVQQAGQQYPGLYWQPGTVPPAPPPAGPGMQYSGGAQQYAGATSAVPPHAGHLPGSYNPAAQMQQPPPQPMLDRDDPNGGSMPISGDAPNLGNLALFGGMRDEDDEWSSHDLARAFKQRRAWYKHPYVKLVVLAIFTTVGFVIAGVVLQKQVHERFDVNTTAFRWMYFIAAILPFWLIIDVLMHWVFMWVEWFFFRESLLFLKNVQRASVNFLLLIALLPWYKAMFYWAWCGEDECESSAYTQAIDTIWKIILCITLFFLANLIKAVAAKFLSTHFYRNAHFKKLQAALEKEFFLQVLSRPRSKAETRRRTQEAYEAALHEQEAAKAGDVDGKGNPAPTSTTKDVRNNSGSGWTRALTRSFALATTSMTPKPPPPLRTAPSPLPPDEAGGSPAWGKWSVAPGVMTGPGTFEKEKGAGAGTGRKLSGDTHAPLFSTSLTGQSLYPSPDSRSPSPPPPVRAATAPAANSITSPTSVVQSPLTGPKASAATAPTSVPQPPPLPVSKGASAVAPPQPQPQPPQPQFQKVAKGAVPQHPAAPGQIPIAMPVKAAAAAAPVTGPTRPSATGVPRRPTTTGAASGGTSTTQGMTCTVVSQAAATAAPQAGAAGRAVAPTALGAAPALAGSMIPAPYQAATLVPAVAESAASVSATTAAAAPSASAVADAAASMAPPPPPPADVPDVPPSAPPPPESVVSESLESVDARDTSPLSNLEHLRDKLTAGTGAQVPGNPAGDASAHAVSGTRSAPAQQQAQQPVAGSSSRAVAAPPPAGATPPVSAFAAAAPSAADVLRPFLPTDLTMVEVPVLRPMQSSQQLTQSSLSRATSQGSSGALSPRGGSQHHYQQLHQQRPQSVQGSVHGSMHGSPTHRHQPLSHIAHLTGRNTPLGSPRATQDFPGPQHQQQLLLPAGPSGAVSPRSTMSAFASGRGSPVLSPTSSYGGQRGVPGHTDGMATPRSTSESLSSHMRTSTGQPLRPMSPLMTNLMARQYSTGMHAAGSHGGGEGGSRPMSPATHQDISLVHGIAHGSARSDAIPEDAPLTMLPDPMAMGHLGGSGTATAVPHGAADVQLEFRPHSRTRRAPHPLSHSVPPAATQAVMPRSASVASPLQEGVLRASLGSNSPLPRPETVMALVGAAAPVPATTGMRSPTPGGVEAASATVAATTAGMRSPTSDERGQRSGRRMSADVAQGGPSSALLQTSSSHGAPQQQQRRAGSNGISDGGASTTAAAGTQVLAGTGGTAAVHAGTGTTTSSLRDTQSGALSPRPSLVPTDSMTPVPLRALPAMGSAALASTGSTGMGGGVSGTVHTSAQASAPGSAYGTPTGSVTPVSRSRPASPSPLASPATGGTAGGTITPTRSQSTAEVQQGGPLRPMSPLMSGLISQQYSAGMTGGTAGGVQSSTQGNTQGGTSGVTSPPHGCVSRPLSPASDASPTHYADAYQQYQQYMQRSLEGTPTKVVQVQPGRSVSLSPTAAARRATTDRIISASPVSDAAAGRAPDGGASPATAAASAAASAAAGHGAAASTLPLGALQQGLVHQQRNKGGADGTAAGGASPPHLQGHAPHVPASESASPISGTNTPNTTLPPATLQDSSLQSPSAPETGGSLPRLALAPSDALTAVPARQLPVLSSTALGAGTSTWAHEGTTAAVLAATAAAGSAAPASGGVSTPPAVPAALLGSSAVLPSTPPATLRLPPGPLQAQLSNSNGTRPDTPVSPPHHVAIQVAPSPASSMTSLPAAGLSGAMGTQDLEQAAVGALQGPGAGTNSGAGGGNSGAGTGAGLLMTALGNSNSSVNGAANTVPGNGATPQQPAAGKAAGNTVSGLPPKVPVSTSRLSKDSNAPLGAFGAGAAGAAAAAAALAAGGSGGGVGTGSHGGVTGGGVTGVTLHHTLTPIAESGPDSTTATGTGAQAERTLSHVSYLQSGPIPSTTNITLARATPLTLTSSRGGRPRSSHSKRRGGGAGSTAGTDRGADGARGGPSFTHPLGPLGEQLLEQTVPLASTERKDPAQMTEAELEKVRTAVVIKTYTAIIRNYSSMSREEQEREMLAVKAFSRALFYNVRGPDVSKMSLTLEDFELFFDSDEHAQRAFSTFDANNDGSISKRELREAVEHIYRERTNMAASLKDTDSIVQSLEYAIGALVHFIFLALYLLIWNIDIVKGFSTFSATLLAFTFIFGNSVKNMFESMLFLFVEHPYDVGDNVYIKDELYRVKKISLLYTEMIAMNGERMFFPNTMLMPLPISNYTRAKSKTEYVKIQLDVGVHPDVLADIMGAMREHSDLYPTEYEGPPFVQYRNLADPLKIVIMVSWTYAFPPDDWKRLVPARNAMFGILQAKLAEHKLKYSP